MHEYLDQGSILHHVTDCEDQSIEPSILIEYQWKQSPRMRWMKSNQENLSCSAKSCLAWSYCDKSFQCRNITISHLEKIHDRTTDLELNKRFSFSPEFPFFSNISDLDESSLSIGFHEGNCCLELVMKQDPCLWDFFNKIPFSILEFVCLHTLFYISYATVHIFSWVVQNGCELRYAGLILWKESAVLNLSAPEILQRPAPQQGAPLLAARAPSAPAPLPTLHWASGWVQWTPSQWQGVRLQLLQSLLTQLNLTQQFGLESPWIGNWLQE